MSNNPNDAVVDVSKLMKNTKRLIEELTVEELTDELKKRGIRFIIQEKCTCSRCTGLLNADDYYPSNKEEECPECGYKLISNYYVDESRPMAEHRIYGVTCTVCGYEKWDR